MRLTPFVRTQLIVFSVLTVVGLFVMATAYVRVPAMLGVGQYRVTVRLDASGGLYPHANVTFLGTTVGTVDAVVLRTDGVNAELSLAERFSIPADVDARVRSVSAIGEQYVDLVPSGSASDADLADGDVIPVDRTQLPQDVGEILDQADRLLDSVADTELRDLLSGAFEAFNGTGPDLQRLLDSAHLLVQEAEANSDQTRLLIDQAGPLLDTQVVGSDDIRSWTDDLTRVTGRLRESEPTLESLVDTAPGALGEANRLFDDLRPTLPLLLANLVSVGQVTSTYNPGIEQVLVVFPPLVAALGTTVRGPLEDGALVDFHLQFEDPPACTTGFLSSTQWRSPTDTTVVDTPDNLFCKVPQDSPMVVRGARNLPCMEYPGRRAATVEACRSGEPYVPEGTNPWRSDTPAPEVRPSSDTTTAARQYDPQTGVFVGPDGRRYTQPGIAPGGAARTASSWQDMMTAQQG
ncbi:MCE family protein [Rhodococcus gannanensis]|uniref:MCE family protein n=1 Tax=Rhodococcus gannanensis TaxID=1960308 RepID=A0ABW4P948_9NOCA